MQKNRLTFLLFILGGTLLLFPGFHGDQWNMVRVHNYRGWQTTSERVVVARLAKSQQDGLFSAGGLLGLLDSEDGWIFGQEIANHQYQMYETGQEIQSYLVYKSHPGFQGFVFGIFDRLTSFPASINLEIFRGSVALCSSMIVALISAAIAVEFGWLAAILVLLFAVISEWMILPAGSLYWNLWAFYLPFVCGMFLLADSAKKNHYPTMRVVTIIFVATLIKILFTGFELITAALVMATVPLVYFAVRDQWGWKTFFNRMWNVGLALIAATLSGLAFLAIQIAVNDGSLSSSVEYLTDTLNRRATGDPENFRGVYAESLSASALEVIVKYLNVRAFGVQIGDVVWNVYYWQLIVLFAIFTAIYSRRWLMGFRSPSSGQGFALLATTWYSLAAPLSWYIIFKPTSYIHTFLFPMAWQMPFVLLGLALCGFTIQDLFKKKTVEYVSSPSPSSQTD